MLTIADTAFSSHLFMGTGKFAHPQQMVTAIQASGTELVTMALKRIDLHSARDDILPYLQKLAIKLLPNTSGAKDAQEAIFAANLAREALQTNWLKLEIHPDAKYLLPDNLETLKAAEVLVKQGFVVLPYCGADPVVCRQLAELGCAAVMPLAAPIGSNQGLTTKALLRIIIEQATVPVVIDAGIGAPSQALEAFELGADAVLVNTAIAVAPDPRRMAAAFKLAVEAGVLLDKKGVAQPATTALASSPLTAFLHQQKIVTEQIN